MLDYLPTTTPPNPYQVLDENVRHMCVVHSHLLLMLRNISPAEITDGLAKTALCAMAFLATRHQWNKELLDAWGGDGMAPSYDCWRVPEHELYEVLHVLRRKLVLWLRGVASQRQLDLVLGGVVRVSEGSGALLPPPRAVPQRWAYLGAADEGRGNLGRFTVHSTRARLPMAHAYAAEAVQALGREAEDAVVFDVQVMQLTLMAAHPQALKHEVAEMADVVEMFGDVAMQARLTTPSPLTLTLTLTPTLTPTLTLTWPCRRASPTTPPT